jgi:MFS family permease
VVRRFSAAMLGTALGLLPVLALGALAALIRPELEFSEGRLGLAVAVFFAASALFSVPAGTLSERWGSVPTARCTVALGAASLVGVALFATSWATLLPWMIVAGAGNAAAQVATNGLVANVLPPDRNGVAFGIKQSASPMTSLVVGLSIPVVGITVGWRWTFAAAALLAIPALLLLGRTPVGDRAGRQRSGHLRGRRAPLVVLAASAALGAGAVNCLNAFYVESAVDDGVGLAQAGLFFAVGGVSGTAVRLIGGWWSDHAKVGRLTISSAMLATGSAAFLGLGLLDASLLLPATVLAFGAGWGWNGLILAAVVDAYPHAPAAATGVTQAGLYAGAVGTPVLFGFLVQYVGYAAAWSSAAISLLLGASLLLVGARMLPARPPAA